MYQHCQVFEDLMHLANLLLDFFYPLLPFLNNSLIKRNLIVQQYKFLSVTTTTTNQSKDKPSQYFVCINFTFLIPQEAHAALDAYLPSHLSHSVYSYIYQSQWIKIQDHKASISHFWFICIYLDGGDGLVTRGA